MHFSPVLADLQINKIIHAPEMIYWERMTGRQSENSEKHSIHLPQRHRIKDNENLWGVRISLRSKNIFSTGEDLCIMSELETLLSKNFRFQDFRPGQEKAIQSLLEDHNTLVVMPTGSGKSLIYQLTSLLKSGVTLVISPLIALMKNQVDSLKTLGIPATFINSSLSRSELDHRMTNFSSGKYRLVYIAPERLRRAQFLEAIQHQCISLLVVDEAHCISEWGHDFRPDYLYIAQFRAEINDPLTIALTATATPKVQEDIIQLLGVTNVERVITGFNRPNLELEVRYVSDQTSKYKVLLELVTDIRDGATIVYTGTRRDAEEAAEFVKTVTLLNAEYYHAGLSSEERSRVQEIFLSGDLSIVAATNAFGMGIDRPDVRQVIHFSLPGSLEAYYQEAGRAGRDGLPAKAILLYSPEDRALQEWFIENSIIGIHEIRMIYDALHQPGDHVNSVSYEQLSISTGLHEVKIRIGLAELERSGFLDRMADEGFLIRYRLNGWKEAEISLITERLARHQAHRKAQLKQMIYYAESNTCRRQIILNHFGDFGSAEADICCDNCQAQKPIPAAVRQDTASLELSERVALIILDTVRRLKWGVGREKITQILKGSKAKDIIQVGYDKHAYYGRFAVFSQKEIGKLIDGLEKQRYLKVVGGDYPILKLTPLGEAAIVNKIVIPLELPRTIDHRSIERKKAERQAGGTVEYTEKLLSTGASVVEVAAIRGLSPGTIYSHAAKLIAGGKISVDLVIPDDVSQQIEAAIIHFGSVNALYPIKLLLPEDIDYNVIRCVVEGWKLKAAEGQKLTQCEQAPIPLSRVPETVDNFLSRSHPRKLHGPWKSGWALDFHSQFIGAEWKRSQTGELAYRLKCSQTGELAYRLKYHNDLTVLPALVDQAEILISQHPELTQVDAVIPVPPSTPRSNDPVSCFTQAFTQRLNLKYQPVLEKSRTTSMQKEMHILAQKKANVANAFKLIDSVQNMRVLVIDDLFDSGATLEEIVRLLTKAQVQSVCVMTLTRSIHTDA
jgi:ATP-dependent DNA helicase RecQ